MRFENETRFPAALLRTVIDDERLSASVIARITYDIVGSKLVPAAEQPYIVSPEPWDSPHGKFENDQPFKTGGVDLFVFGHAYAPAGRRTIASMVSVIVGRFRRDVHVIGARTWTRAGGTLVPGSPQTFAAVPLTLQYAFGGKAEWDETMVAWPDNPEGLGFYVEEKQAEGHPMPMLEDPAHLIRKWDDRPPVVGFGLCPLQSGPRIAAGMEFDAEKGQITKLKPRMLNTAYPALVAPEAPAGAPVALLGVTRSGQLELSLPRELPRAEVQLGDATHRHSLEIDQIGVDVEANRAFISYRFPFRYRMVREQKRRVTLTAPEA